MENDSIKSCLYNCSFKVLLLNLITFNQLIAAGVQGDDGQIKVFALLVFIVSLLLFFRLLPKWRFLRRFLRYKNTPTSNLKSLAVGNVQVNGKIVKPDNILHSPIHNAECVYYDSYVEVRKHRLIPIMKWGRWKWWYWKKIYKNSKYVPFSINDGTGIVNVDLEGAGMELKTDHESPGALMGQNEALDNFCKENNINMKGWFFKKFLRYDETFLEHSDKLYILGKAEIRENNENDTLTICEVLASDMGEEKLRWSVKNMVSISIPIILASFSLAFLIYTH